MQWQWDVTPPAGTPNATTGGMTWMTGTYDPELNLVYWGTGNPTPVLNGNRRPGDNPYTCSIVAINPDNGKLAWGFSVSPHDTHDWDAVETPVLVDADFHGQPRKMLMQTSRNGYFFVLDRTNGKSLLTVPYGPVNWALGIDKQGRPIPNPDKEPAPDGRLIAPDEGGLTNYRSPSFDPKTGLFIVDAHPSYSIYFAKPADGTYGWAGADYGLWGKGVIEAIDYQTGKIRWSHEVGRRRLRRGRDDDRFGTYLHRRRLRQRAGARHEQRQDLVACGHRRADAEFSHHLRTGWPPIHRHQQRRSPFFVDAPGAGKAAATRASTAPQ